MPRIKNRYKYIFHGTGLRPLLATPYIAVLLLFGLLLGLTFSHFLRITWTRAFTVTTYLAALLFLVPVLIKQHRTWWRPNKLDWVVFIFWLVIIISATFPLKKITIGHSSPILYMPFMVILPYLCGRLMLLSELHILSRTIVTLGVFVAICVIFDRLLGTAHNPYLRPPIFGHEHGRLLVGSLMAAALSITSYYCLSLRSQRFHYTGYSVIIALYCVLILILTTLISIMARGWLLSALIGVVILVLVIKNPPPLFRLSLIGAITITVTSAHFFFQKEDPHYADFNQSQFHALHFENQTTSQHPIGELAALYLLREECALLSSTNSISVRSKLYQEAIVMFRATPFVGVGSGKFGSYSCWAATNAHPHSTILHVFSEMGILGGIPFITACIFALAVLFHAKSRAYRCYFVLLCIFLIADQVYNTYFMAAPTWLCIGIAASTLTQTYTQTHMQRLSRT